MKKRFRIFTAAALTASLSVTAAFAGSATEAPEEVQEENSVTLPAGITSDALQDALELPASGAEGAEAKIEFGDLFRQLLSQSEEGSDMSWLKTITMESVAAAQEDGSLDASVSYSLNDTPLYDGQFAYDASSGKIYLCLPQFKEQAFSIDLGAVLEEAMKQGKDSASEGMGQLNISQEDLERLKKDAEDLFSSITEDEVSEFIGRYAQTIISGVTTTNGGTTTATAGSLSADVTLTSIAIQPEAMDQIVQTSAASLRDDPLALKVVGSSFAADVVNLFANMEASEGDSGSAQITKDQLAAAYQQFFDENKDSLSGLPGFSLTYGQDAAGKIATVSFKLIYQGVEMELFSYAGINDGVQNAYEFNLGQVIASALAAEISSSAGTENTQQAASGKTGLLLEGSVDNGKLNETVTVRVNDQAVFAAQVADFDVEKFRQGTLDGNIAASIASMDVRLAFESASPDTQAISVLLNEQNLLTVTAQKVDAAPADVKMIDKASAVEVKSEEDFDAFFKDADLTTLQSNLAAAGVPQEVIDQIFFDDSSAGATDVAGTDVANDAEAETDAAA